MAGNTDTDQGKAIWKSILESFEPPPLDPAIDEELSAYVAKRKEEIAADRA